MENLNVLIVLVFAIGVFVGFIIGLIVGDR